MVAQHRDVILWSEFGQRDQFRPLRQNEQSVDGEAVDVEHGQDHRNDVLVRVGRLFDEGQLR